MSDYNELKAIFNRQVEASAPSWQGIVKKGRAHKRQLVTAQLVMGITVAILIYFFFYISAYKVPEVAFALMAMIGALVFRILLELYSLLWHNRMPYSSNPGHFAQKLKSYERFRRFVLWIATPVAFIIYVIGFVVLLPYFKAELSEGFYTYILVSGAVVLLFLMLLIGNSIRQEIKILKILRGS